MSEATPSAERLVAIIHESWVKYTRLTAIYLLVLACSLFAFYLAGLTAYHDTPIADVLLVFAAFLLLLTHHWYFMAILSQSENHIIITTERVIWLQHRLFFDEEMHEYSFDKMKTAEARKSGFLQYVFQYGSIKFESGPPIQYIPHPNNVVKIIEQAMGMA